MARVAVVVMPGMAEDGPALGPHLLQGALRERGHACDVLYLNLPFARSLGLPFYRALDRLSSLLPLEWCFAPSLFPQGLPPAEEYAARVLRRPELDLDRLLAARRAASDFILHAVTSVPWQTYDVVGFSSSFQQNTASLALAARLKEAHPGLPIALGGANAEEEMGRTIARLFPRVDAVFSGEADRTFPAWIDALAASDAGRMPKVPDPEPVTDMDGLPIPDFADYYDALARSRLDLAPSSTHLRLELSRGCWWGERAHCTFCGLNGATMSWRRKSTDRFLAELDTMKRWPTRSVLLTDNILDARAAEEFLPRLAEAKTGFRFFAEIKAPLPAATATLLAEAGVRRIQPGLESLATPSLGRMRKGTRAVENVAVLIHALRTGIAATWNLLVGFPRETAEDLDTMTALIPLLHHLPPPLGLYPVEIHRFAPLHADRERLGVGPIRPAPAYEHAYALSAEEREGLAYVFERTTDDWPDAYVAAAARLADAVDAWRLRACSGHSQLFYLDDGRTLHGLDTRACARERRWTADGGQRALLLSCQEPRRLPVDSHALAALKARRLMIELDGHALALPIASDVTIEGGETDNALAIAEQLHAGRLKQLVAEAGGGA